MFGIPDGSQSMSIKARHEDWPEPDFTKDPLVIAGAAVAGKTEGGRASDVGGYNPTMLSACMGTLARYDSLFEYQWASDVEFDGIRLEVLAGGWRNAFDISVPEHGPTMSTPSREKSKQNLIVAALAIAQSANRGNRRGS